MAKGIWIAVYEKIESMETLKKYNWIISLLCSFIWLIQYIRVEQSYCYLGGVATFALMSYSQQPSNKGK